MIFLIDYDRRLGRLNRMTAFLDEQRGLAEDERLRLELASLASGQPSEVVLLEAANEAALHRTHQRYFESVAGILAGSHLFESLTDTAVATSSAP